MSRDFEIIKKSIELHPDDWEIERFELRNYKVGIDIWISNGPLFYGCDDSKVKFKFNLLDKLRFYFVFKKLRTSKLLRAMRKKNEPRISTKSL